MTTPQTEDIDLAAPSVVAVVVAVEDVSAAETIDAIGRQAYGVDDIYVIGDPNAGDDRVTPVPSLGELVLSLDPGIEFIWLLHGDAKPRPDALGALVAEARRSDAAVTGSKILDAVHTDRLEFVGGSSDVFGEPYTGLDEDEVDLEQYDVVRDVGHVSAVSLLIRRDLMKGLQGLDSKLAPGSGGIDLSQRARVAGARILIVPSSEVFHSSECRHDVKSWREQASRMRAMFKAYRLITLAWVIPIGFLIAMLDGFARFGLRQFRPFFDYLRALGWNLIHLPSTASARRALRRVRVSGDEELFRYQVAGSLRFRSLVGDIGSRLGWIIDREPGVVDESELGDDPKVASAIVFSIAMLVVAAVARATFGRGLLSGLWLPLDSGPWSVVGGYAGGWNPTGLGSPEPVPPIVAGVSLVQGLLLGWGGAQGLLSLASPVTAVWGIGRFLELSGFGGPSRFLAGVIYTVGPLAMMSGAGGDWPAMLVLGPLAWTAVWMTDPGHGRMARLGRLLLAGMLGGAAIVSFPLWVAVLGVLLGVCARRWVVIWRAMIVAAGALAASAPYLRAVSVETLLSGGLESVWSWWTMGAGLVAAVLMVIAGSDRSWRTAALGGILVSAAGVVGLADVVGSSIQVGGMIFGSFGLACVAGVAWARDEEAGGFRRAVQILAGLAAALVLVAGLPAVVEGTWGMPVGDWERRLGFVEALSDNPEMERVLLVGEPGSLPGRVRRWNDLDYRLVNGARFGFDEAYLPERRRGDVALEGALTTVASGVSLRPGEMLAPFAIRWIVVVGDDTLARAFQSQVDVRDVSSSPGVAVFENLAYRPRIRAEQDGWEGRGGRFDGPPTTQVVLADNFDDGWNGTADDWANRIPAASGTVRYVPDPRGMALGYLAGMVLVGSIGAIWWGRKR